MDKCTRCHKIGVKLHRIVYEPSVLPEEDLLESIANAIEDPYTYASVGKFCMSCMNNMADYELREINKDLYLVLWEYV